MLPTPPLEHLRSPALPVAPPRAGFPIVATVAPVAVSVGIWAVTGSIYSLLFAALGPIVAVGSLADGRRQRRRSVRREREAALAAFARAQDHVAAIHARERARRDQLAPGPARVAASRAAARWAMRDEMLAALPVRIGVADLAPVVEIAFDDQSHDAVSQDAAPELVEAVESLRRAGATLRQSPWLEDARDGIAVLGPASIARAVARSLALQAITNASPLTASLIAPTGENWVSHLPHATSFADGTAYRVDTATSGDPSSSTAEQLIIAWGEEGAGVPPGAGHVVRIDPASSSAVDASWTAIGAVQATAIATQLRELAAEHGLGSSRLAIPESVSLADLLAEPLSASSREVGANLSAPIGRGPDGVVELDLVRDGPHAVVAGTTGTGKSELLVSWVLAMAARHPPSTVTFLLVDFKGGAAFSPLVGLPHVVGLVSDLDARRSRRAIESLRAELLRRETLLADRGARSIDELESPSLARLVIVVDEFAAVVSGQPELHEVFADLAARGRSLGLHLVLCTQRPAGVIRDGVLANVTLRISLRVMDRGDSIAMLGGDAASRLAPEPRGRAVIADGSGSLREVQLALADRTDADRVREGWAGDASAPSVWCDPLPEILPIAELMRLSLEQPDALSNDGSHGAVIFGRIDLPAEQRQPIARHDPRLHGHLLVLGAPGAGTTNALATFARDPRSRVLPADPADAWSVLDELEHELARTSGGGTVTRGRDDIRMLIMDDLDVLIDRFEPDTRHEFVERLTRLARESRAVCLIAGAQRLSGPLQRLAGLFGSRLLLRQPSRDEHMLAGGDAGSFDARLPAGAGTWRGMTVQVGLVGVPMREADLPALPRVQPHAGPVAGEDGQLPLAIVAGRPRELARGLAARGVLVVQLGEGPLPDELLELSAGGPASWSAGRPSVLLGDPDAWQAEWSLLNVMRRETAMVLTGCSPSELRAIARIRDVPPPLGTRAGECWLANGGEVRRAILDLEMRPEGRDGMRQDR